MRPVTSPYHASVGTLRKHIARDIKVRIIGKSPGIIRSLLGHKIPGILGSIRIIRINVSRFSDARFSYIVPCSPCKITYHIRKLFHHGPAESDLLGEVLGSEDHSLRIHLMVSFVDVLHVVVSHHVESVGEGFRHCFLKG